MICGVDEAGRGPCFGPLVVAGVLIKDEKKLESINVKDSKLLTSQRRTSLLKEIKKISYKIEILTIPASDIDEMRRLLTLNQIEVNAFSKVIDNLKPEICYVDAADVNEKRFANDILSRIKYKPKIISKHKADSIYPVVSAASIVAKTFRDEQVEKISKKLSKKLNVPLGSGYPADPITKEFLKKWMERYNDLPPYTRKSWKTCQKLVSNNKTKKLDDF